MVGPTNVKPRFLSAFDMTMSRWLSWSDRARNFLTKIKDGIYSVASRIGDLFFSAVKEIGKIVQPHVQRIITKAKDLVTGFISWMFNSTFTVSAA